jgi:hypothetical protein
LANCHATGLPGDRLRTLFEGLADKGPVLDLWGGDEYYYMPSPMVIGLFEFAMMRTGPDVDTRKLAGLFHHYLSGDRAFEAADKFAIGICSCRHEKLHAATKECDVPLESCTSFGLGAD